MEHPLLLSPHPPTTNHHTSPPLSTILIRLSSFLFLFSAALYANYEASKGFEITVLRSSPSKSPAAGRFDLFFISNGRASRTIIHCSNHIEKILYPNSFYPRKLVNHVILQLATHDLPEPVLVTPGCKPGSFVMSLSPSLVLGKDAGRAVESAVRRGMARVWVWDGEGTAPAKIVNAMVEALSGPGPGADPIGVDGLCWAQLNREMRMMKGRWREGAWPMERLCAENLSKLATGLRQGM